MHNKHRINNKRRSNNIRLKITLLVVIALSALIYTVFSYSYVISTLYAIVGLYDNFTSPYIGVVSPPMPTGIASYGTSSLLGFTTLKFIVKTDSLYGLVNISNASAKFSNVNSNISQNIKCIKNETYSNNLEVNSSDYNHSFSIQLNGVLFVENNNGTQTYFLQDAVGINSLLKGLYLADNVWNESSLNATYTRNSITGGGGICNFVGKDNTPFGDFSYEQGLYYYISNNTYNYTLPLILRLFINESYKENKGIYINFYVEKQNGDLFPFNSVFIRDRSLKLAYILVDGYNYTPVFSYYDAELIIGGFGGGASVLFNGFNSTLKLLYYNEILHRYSYFPSYYSFGRDTGEGAYDLHVSFYDGNAVVSKGTPDYTYLGRI